MARVRLGRYEAEEGHLPPVCMRCGAPATLTKDKSFAWHPPWVYVLVLAGLLPFVIVALVLTKKMRVAIPLCDAHKRHWFVRGTWIWGLFFAVPCIWFGTMFALARLEQAGVLSSRDGVIPILGCSGCLFPVLAWLVSIVLIQNTAIHATEITDRGIALDKVSDKFVEAVRQARTDNVPYAEEARPRRRPSPPTDQFFDPDAPPRQRDREDSPE